MCAKLWRTRTLAEDCRHATVEPYVLDAHAGVLRCHQCGKTVGSSPVSGWVSPALRTPFLTLR